MIEDMFFKRYEHEMFRGCRDTGGLHPNVQRVVSQAAQIFANDVINQLELNEEFFASAQEKLTRELGSWPFPDDKFALDTCGRFLSERYDLWENRHGSVDTFVKIRLSMIELLYRDAAKLVQELPGRPAGVPQRALERLLTQRTLKAVQSGQPTAEAIRVRKVKTLRKAIQEMNARFRAADIPLHYHNGLIQLAEHDLSQDRIAEPFWSITCDPKWQNVDEDMKRAIDLADTGGPDSVLYATMALESAIKIISDEKGWTSGREKGALNYVDNLVTERNGYRFIAVWEKDTLGIIFTKLRNPHGHGPGSEPQPIITDQQTTWAIETCMSWIKSLIRRM